MSVQSLFDAVGLAPALPGARCRHRHRLFDEPERDANPDDAEYQQQAALRLCSGCPSLVRCRTWLESLPKAKRPPGVVAGVVQRDQTRTPNTEVSVMASHVVDASKMTAPNFGAGCEKNVGERKGTLRVPPAVLLQKTVLTPAASGFLTRFPCSHPECSFRNVYGSWDFYGVWDVR